jgi:DNA-binding IclR family transcriptional regulator
LQAVADLVHSVQLNGILFRYTEQYSRDFPEEKCVESLGTVEKAVEVLFHLHGESSPQGVTAIGRALGLPKSSAHRLLAALGRRGLVERDEGGRYRTGIGLVALGLGVLESEPIVVAARPVLEEAAQALGETFFLVAARAGRLVVLDKAEGTGFLRAAPRVGSSVPVHATAVGKLFLAFGGDAITAPAEPFERFSENTCTRAHELASDVERARRRGFAENREEWIPGLSVLAAPVRAGDRMLGAVAMAASSHHFLVLGAEEIAQRALAAAERIAARLEGTGR